MPWNNSPETRATITRLLVQAGVRPTPLTVDALVQLFNGFTKEGKMINDEWYEESLLHVRKQLETVIRDINEDVAFKDTPFDRRQAIRRLNYAINIIALADENDLVGFDGDCDG